MHRTFSTRDILVLVAFALALAAVDIATRGSSGCVQCQVDLLQQSMIQQQAGQ